MASDGPNNISEITRRDIMDTLSTEGVAWSGRLEEADFLGRIWNLQEVRSTDNRFAVAAGDIHQHRVNNWDWEDDWVFHDERFNLLRCPGALFGHFLAEMCHPVVRKNAEEARALAEVLNGILAGDQWELAEVSQMSGRPMYEARPKTGYRQPKAAIDVDEYARLREPQVLSEHLERIERDLGADPPAAIGSSKELAETVCKAVLRDYEVRYKPGADLPELYKQVQDVLRLNQSAVPDSKKGSEAAVKTLRALVTTIQSLSELRNALGTGHGRERKSPALSRHARLAFNATVALSEFLLDTWHERRGQD